MVTQKLMQELIHDYINNAAQVVATLRRTFGCRNLTAAVRSRQIPRLGEIQHDTFGKISFQFHGRGCFVSAGSLKIDIELCGDSDIVGFDAWRLWRYASETLGWGDVDPDELQTELDLLLGKQLIRFSKESPLFGLYYLTSDEQLLSAAHS